MQKSQNLAISQGFISQYFEKITLRKKTFGSL